MLGEFLFKLILDNIVITLVVIAGVIIIAKLTNFWFRS